MYKEHQILTKIWNGKITLWHCYTSDNEAGWYEVRVDGETVRKTTTPLGAEFVASKLIEKER